MSRMVSESDIAEILTNAVWVLCCTYHTVLKISPGAGIFESDMFFDAHSLLTDLKLGNTDTNKQTEYTQGKHVWVYWIINLVTKYCCVKVVSSAKPKADMKVIHILLRQFIWMALERFNTEPNLTDWVLGESDLILTKKDNTLNHITSLQKHLHFISAHHLFSSLMISFSRRFCFLCSLAPYSSVHWGKCVVPML